MAIDSNEKRAVIVLWDKWAATHVASGEATRNDGLKFYDELQALGLPGKTHDWGTLHGWLLSEKRVID